MMKYNFKNIEFFRKAAIIILIIALFLLLVIQIYTIYVNRRNQKNIKKEYLNGEQDEEAKIKFLSS